MKFEEPFLFEVRIKEIGGKKYIEFDKEMQMAVGRNVESAVIGIFEVEDEEKKAQSGSPPYPMPGDFVRVEETDDILIKVGSLGLIEGHEGVKKDVYSVTFNYVRAWWNKDGIIDASGGPVRMIKASDMKYTGEKIDHQFWFFPGLPRAGGGETVMKTVNVFSVRLHSGRVGGVEFRPVPPSSSESRPPHIPPDTWAIIERIKKERRR